MITLESYLRYRLKWTSSMIEHAFFMYADLTMEGVSKTEAFDKCFGIYGVHKSLSKDGKLSQFYNGVDRDYDID